MRFPWLLGFDVLAVVSFVAIGRRTHLESGGVLDVLETAAPFLIALVVGWATTKAWRRPTALTVGSAIAAVTLLGGLLIRRLVFGGGTAPAFVVVAALFLFGAMLGWRIVVRAADLRSSRAGGGRASHHAP